MIRHASTMICQWMVVCMPPLIHTGRSEEEAALKDLVSSGANFLKAVNCLLYTVHTLKEVSSKCMYRYVSCLWLAS